MVASGAPSARGGGRRHGLLRNHSGGDGACRLPHPASSARADHEPHHRHGRHVDPVYQCRTHRMGVRAAALPGTIRHHGLRIRRRARVPAVVLDHGHGRRHHGCAAALPQAHAHRPCHAGHGAGLRGGAAHGSKPDAHDGLHLCDFRHDGGGSRHHAGFNVLCILRDGLHHRVEGFRRGDARRARQHHRGDVGGNPVRLDRDVQKRR